MVVDIVCSECGVIIIDAVINDPNGGYLYWGQCKEHRTIDSSKYDEPGLHRVDWSLPDAL